MANFNFNKVILGGRLTADPELRTTPGGVSVVTVPLAVNSRYKDKDGGTKTFFIDVVAWKQTAEFLSKYFHKSSSVCIVGELQSRSWTDKNGQTRYTVEVMAQEVNFVDSKAEMPMRTAQATVDPNSPAMAGAQDTAERKAEELYATPGAQSGIEDGMSEGDEPLPF